MTSPNGMYPSCMGQPSRGILRNENRTIISWDMFTNVKNHQERGKLSGCLYRESCLLNIGEFTVTWMNDLINVNVTFCYAIVLFCKIMYWKVSTCKGINHFVHRKCICFLYSALTAASQCTVFSNYLLYVFLLLLKYQIEVINLQLCRYIVKKYPDTFSILSKYMQLVLSRRHVHAFPSQFVKFCWSVFKYGLHFMHTILSSFFLCLTNP